MDLSRSSTKRVCLLSPASRTSEAIGNSGAAAGVDAASGAVIGTGTGTGTGGCSAGAGISIYPAHGNAAAHTSAHFSKTRWFARLANDSVPPESPLLTAIEPQG